MFWQRTKQGPHSPSEQEMIVVRGEAASFLALKWPVHLMALTAASAIRHTEVLTPIYTLLGLQVALLPSGGSDSAKSDAYQSRVVIGAIGEFIADVERGLRPEGEIAAVVAGDHRSEGVRILDMASSYVAVILL